MYTWYVLSKAGKLSPLVIEGDVPLYILVYFLYDSTTVYTYCTYDSTTLQ